MQQAGLGRLVAAFAALRLVDSASANGLIDGPPRPRFLWMPHARVHAVFAHSPGVLLLPALLVGCRSLAVRPLPRLALRPATCLAVAAQLVLRALGVVKLADWLGLIAQNAAFDLTRHQSPSFVRISRAAASLSRRSSSAM